MEPVSRLSTRVRRIYAAVHLYISVNKKQLENGNNCRNVHSTVNISVFNPKQTHLLGASEITANLHCNCVISIEKVA